MTFRQSPIPGLGSEVRVGMRHYSFTRACMSALNGLTPLNYGSAHPENILEPISLCAALALLENTSRTHLATQKNLPAWL